MVGQRGTIAKLDEAQGLVYGWASVVVKDGETVVDRQGDIIEPEVLEAAAVDFMLNHRAAGEMHEGGPVGQIVESMVVTPEKLEAMGVPNEIAQAVPTGFWIGVKLDPDGETFAKVKSGELSMFSIQGVAEFAEA